MRQHALKITNRFLDARTVGLIYDEDVGDFHQSRLVGLNGVTPSRIHHNDCRVGFSDNLNLDLPNSNCLDEHPLHTCGVENSGRIRHRHRKPAKVSARRHRPNEDFFVERVFIHPNSIAQDCSTSER
jgi:hypothetical protein